MKPAVRALLALGLSAALSGLTRSACAQQGETWVDPHAVLGQVLVGQKVVTKYKVNLRERERVVDDGSAFRVYTVERAQASRVRLTTGEVSGWVEATQVVPFDQAIAFYTQEMVNSPFPAVPLNHRALIWTEKKEYDFALADYDEAIRLSPNNASAHNNRGNIHRVKKDYDRALVDFDEAIRLEPRTALYYANRAIVWTIKKEFDKAIADHDAAIALNPRLPSAYLNRGHAWMAKKEHDKALADYEKALRLNPKLPLGYLNRGQAWLAKKENDKALADLDEAIRLAPKFAVAFSSRGRVWRAKKEYARALADFDESIRIDPALVMSHNNRAWLLATCPDPAFRNGKGAVDSAQRACALNKWKDPTTLDTLAAAYAESGDFARAVEWQEKANALFTGDEQKEAGERLARYQAHTPWRE